MKFASKMIEVGQRLLGLKKHRPSPRLRRQRRLGIEPLESRTMLAAPTITTFEAVYSGTSSMQVEVTGQISDENSSGVQIYISGAFTGSTTADSNGSFQLFGFAAGPGMVTAIATDDESLDSSPVTATFGDDNAPSQLYETYLADVSQANENYAYDISDAVTMRDSAFFAARAVAESAAIELYDEYVMIATLGAQQSYNEAISLAEANYEIGVLNANNTYAAEIAAAAAVYDSAVSAAQSVYDSAMLPANAAYQAVNDAYVNAVTPYQTAYDEAHADYLCDPENPDVQAALAQAQTDLDAAIATAWTQWDTATLLVDAEFEDEITAADAALNAAVETAGSTYQASLTAAFEDNSVSKAAAWSEYLVARDSAESTMYGDENTAWTSYVSDLALAASALDSGQTAAQSGFDSLLISALSTWQGAEQTAWTTYVSGMASIPDAPPLGERIGAPPELPIPAVPGNPPVMLPMAPMEMAIAPVMLAQVAVEEVVPVEEFNARRGADWNNTLVVMRRDGRDVNTRKWGGEVHINARLAEGVDPANFDFQLFMRGTEGMRITIDGVVRDLAFPARRLRGGMDLHATEWRPDSPRIRFTARDFTRRDGVGHTILETDAAAMTRWAELIRRNSLDNTIVEFNFAYEFEARIIDRRSGDVVERRGYTWSLGGPIDAPVVTTDLEPLEE